MMSDMIMDLCVGCGKPCLGKFYCDDCDEKIKAVKLREKQLKKLEWNGHELIRKGAE